MWTRGLGKLKTDRELELEESLVEALTARKQEQCRASAAERRLSHMKEDLEDVRKQAEAKNKREKLTVSWKHTDFLWRLEKMRSVKEASLTQAHDAERLMQQMKEKAEQAQRTAAEKVQKATSAKQQAEADRAEAATLAEEAICRVREELSQAQSQVLVLHQELETARQQTGLASAEVSALQRSVAEWEERHQQSSQHNMELESRIQALEAHVTQLVQKVVKPMATNMADGEEQAAEILPASAAEWAGEVIISTPAKLIVASPQTLPPWSKESLFGGSYDMVFSPLVHELQIALALTPCLHQENEHRSPSCVIEEVSPDGDETGCEQPAAFGSPVHGPVYTVPAPPAGPDPLPLAPVHFRKRGLTDVGQQAVTPTAVPLLKRARMAGAESINPNSVPRAPAVAASTLVPMPPLATGSAAAPEFCIGQAAMATCKKRRTAAKPTQPAPNQPLGSVSPSQTKGPLVATGVFVFGAGSMPEVQAGPMATLTSADAETAGMTMTTGVQPALTPCMPSQPQRTPETLAPLSSNSLWGPEYSEVFASPLFEWRVALAYSPSLQVPKDRDGSGSPLPAAFGSPVYAMQPQGTPQVLSSMSGGSCDNVKIFDSPLYEATTTELEGCDLQLRACATPLAATGLGNIVVQGTELQPAELSMTAGMTTADAGVQPALRPGQPLLPQSTPEMLPPLTGNSPWSLGYSGVFASPPDELRAALAYSPTLQMQGFDQKLGAGETPLAAVTEGGSTMLQDAELKPAVLCMTAGMLASLRKAKALVPSSHCRKRGLSDVGTQSMTPAALPLLKRARVAGQENTSPNLGRPAPAGRAKTSGEGPFPPVPAMQSAIGSTTGAAFCMGQAALPAVKKRRTVAKPAEHLGGIPSSQATDPLAAAQFDFVFGTGSTRRAQHGPQTALNAPPAGVTMAAGVQPAVTPCQPSLPQRTPEALPPGSDNSLWSLGSSGVFASPLLEHRVALAYSPSLQALVTADQQSCQNSSQALQEAEVQMASGAEVQPASEIVTNKSPDPAPKSHSPSTSTLLRSSCSGPPLLPTPSEVIVKAEVQAAAVTGLGDTMQDAELQPAKLSMSVGMSAKQQRPGKARKSPSASGHCRKRERDESENEAVTPTAVTLLKRARLAGADDKSANIMPPAPAVAPTPLWPAMPSASGREAAPFCVGRAPAPVHKKRRGARKLAQCFGSQPTTEIIDALSAAGVFKFVFRAGMPAAQPGPLVNHGSDAPTTGSEAAQHHEADQKPSISGGQSMQEAEVGGANGNDASGNPADAAAQLLGPLFPAPSKKKRRFSMMQGEAKDPCSPTGSLPKKRRHI